VNARAVGGAIVLLALSGPLGAQSGASDPALAVLDLRFDGEHATVLEAGDTAVARAATQALRATLARLAAVTLIDSSRVAARVMAEEPDGDRCDHACALRVGRTLGARWVLSGTLSKTSTLVWVLIVGLVEVASGNAVLVDTYELKGEATRTVPAGAAAFARRVAKATGARPTSTAP
jgi:Protein of unknown function (DUF2380)